MPPTLMQKLQLKPGQGLAVRNAPPRPPEMLAAEFAERRTSEPASAPDAALLFATALAEIERLTPDAIAAAGYDGLPWLACPKAGSGAATDVSRDRLRQAMVPTGWRPVRQVALDDAWSAVRLRPGGAIGR